MNQPNHILNELLELSPTLASIPKVNVFSVPEGYFESLGTLILLQTSDNKQFGDATVPQGYFESLADSIMNRIRNEAENTSELSPVLAQISKSTVFNVPEGYFEQLPAKMLSLVKDESVMVETSFVSPLVAGIGNKNVFSVPQGYFENFKVKKDQQSPAKVITMNPRRNVFRYAAAAVVTGILAVGSYFMLNNNKAATLTAETAQVVQEGKTIVKTNSFEKVMSGVSDEDIVAYLESAGQDVDAALVASLTDDDKNLPEATDYIIDDKTLDNMLNELELN